MSVSLSSPPASEQQQQHEQQQQQQQQREVARLLESWEESREGEKCARLAVARLVVQQQQPHLYGGRSIGQDAAATFGSIANCCCGRCWRRCSSKQQERFCYAFVVILTASISLILIGLIVLAAIL